MKFYKQLKLNKNVVKSLEFTLSSRYDGLVIMDVPFTPPLPNSTRADYNVPTLRGIRIPTGPDDERPSTNNWYGNSGIIRYNTDGEALEVLTNGQWVQLKAKQPAEVTIQRFGPTDATMFSDPDENSGIEWDDETYPISEPFGTDNEIPNFVTQTVVDGVERFFGPIYDKSRIPPKTAANIFVYVENVFQIPYTNYRLVNASFAAKSPDGFYLAFSSSPPAGKTITVIHGFD